MENEYFPNFDQLFGVFSQDDKSTAYVQVQSESGSRYNGPYVKVVIIIYLQFQLGMFIQHQNEAAVGTIPARRTFSILLE